MGIKDKLLNLFRRKTGKKANIQSNEVIQYDTSFINIPKYLELSDEDKVIADKYIDEVDFSKIEGLILYADKMFEYANINTNLLVRLLYRITDTSSNLELSKLSKEEIAELRLNSKVQKDEVELYRNALIYLLKESSLRCSALVEVLRREGKRKFDFLGFFGRAERLKRENRIQLLESAIERMKIGKKTIEQQIQAVDNIIQNESIVEDNISRRSNDLLGKSYMFFQYQILLRRKINEKKQMVSLVSPKSINIFENIELNNKNVPLRMIYEERATKALAIAQRKLDIYAHTHTDELEKLRKEISMLGNAVNVNNRSQILSRIKDIQLMYKIFSEHVNYEDLGNLYEAKFKALVTDLSDLKELPFKDIEDKEEMSFYISKLHVALEEIIKGKNIKYNEYFGKNVSKSIRLLKEIYVKENGDFSPQKMNFSRKILGLLVAFGFGDGISDFIKMKIFDGSDLLMNFSNLEFVWESSLSLKTIYQLEKMFNNIHSNPYLVLIQLGNVSELIPQIYTGFWDTKLLLPEEILELTTYDAEGNGYERQLSYYIDNADEIMYSDTLKIADGIPERIRKKMKPLNEKAKVMER